jgi:hypothetical protein
MARFWLLHGAYPSFEMINLALGVVATILLVQAAPALPVEAQKSPTRWVTASAP